MGHLTLAAVFATVVILAAVPVYANDATTSYHLCFAGWKPTQWFCQTDKTPQPETTSDVNPIALLTAAVVKLESTVSEMKRDLREVNTTFGRAVDALQVKVAECDNDKDELNAEKIDLNARIVKLSTKLAIYESGEFQRDVLTTIVFMALWACYAPQFPIIYGLLFVFFRFDHGGFWESMVSIKVWGLDVTSVMSYFSGFKLWHFGYWTFFFVGNSATFLIGIFYKEFLLVIRAAAIVKCPPIAHAIDVLLSVESSGTKVTRCLNRSRDGIRCCGTVCCTCCHECRTCCRECRAGKPEGETAPSTTEGLATPVVAVAAETSDLPVPKSAPYAPPAPTAANPPPYTAPAPAAPATTTNTVYPQQPSAPAWSATADVPPRRERQWGLQRTYVRGGPVIHLGED